MTAEIVGTGRRVLVCGGRDYADASHLNFTLDQIHKEVTISVLIHGAARGADSLAGKWATKNGIDLEEYPADWERDGKAAGPIRNLRMLSEGKPDLVVAFKGGVGTAHMMKIARAHGIQVVKVAPIV